MGEGYTLNCFVTLNHFFIFFFKYASEQIGNLKQGLQQLEEVQSSLSEFFCEDKSTFKIDECCKQFAAFTSALKQVTKLQSYNFSFKGLWPKKIFFTAQSKITEKYFVLQDIFLHLDICKAFVSLTCHNNFCFLYVLYWTKIQRSQSKGSKKPSLDFFLPYL